MSTPWQSEKKGPHVFKLATGGHRLAPRACSECPLPENNQIHTTGVADESTDTTKARIDRDAEEETGA